MTPAKMLPHRIKDTVRKTPRDLPQGSKGWIDWLAITVTPEQETYLCLDKVLKQEKDSMMFTVQIERLAEGFRLIIPNPKNSPGSAQLNWEPEKLNKERKYAPVVEIIEE
jgi:hypothetical protein